MNIKINKLKINIITILISLIAVTSLVFSCACNKEVVLNETELAFLNLINDVRIENNLNPLIPNQKLMDLAVSRCSEILERNYLPLNLLHYTVEGKRVKYGEILGRSNFIAIPEEFLNAWLNSQTHKEVILNPIYKKIGIGIIDNGDSRIIVILFSSR